MQCGADGVRGSPGGCENTELRSEVLVWDQPKPGTSPADRGRAPSAAKWLAGGINMPARDLFGWKDWRGEMKGRGSQVEPVVPTDREDAEGAR